MNYSKDDIIRYLKSEMSHSETHDFEKTMLDDAFLRDAVEGFQTINEPDEAEELIEEVYEKAGGKKYAAKTVSMFSRTTAIAASLTLILISAAIIFSFPEIREGILAFTSIDDPVENQTQEISESENDLAAKSSESSVNELAKDEENIAEITDLKQDLSKKTSGSAPDRDNALTTEEAGQNQELAIAVKEEFLDDELVDDPPTELIGANDAFRSVDSSNIGLNEDETILREIAEQQVLMAETQGIQAEAKTSNPAASRARAVDINPQGSMNIFGKVLSAEDQTAIPGVNVIVAGTNRGTISNKDGQYSLHLNEGEDELTFSFIGYGTHLLPITVPGEYIVLLDTDFTKLSEVVVTGYGGQTEEEFDRFSVPVNGRTAYNRYLRENISYPESASENEVKGKVIIEFTVGLDGSLSGFEVIRSIGFGCDEEALRLVQDGPGWLPAIRRGEEKEERVRVAVRFKPPNP